jgi:[acyl-carrier-protein] S-malonyltransferase
MGVDLAARWPSVASRFAEASAVLGYDLLELCTAGPEDRLADTRVAQPALFTVGFATWEVLKAGGMAPAFMAGHSLGEYTACAAAGAISFADGLAAVKARCEAMGEAAAQNKGGMSAIMGGDADGWVAAASSKGRIVVANRNTADQAVVSGEIPALEAVENAAKAAGARAIRLKVSGAFHSPLMQSAADRMRTVLGAISFAAPNPPVVGNVAALVLVSADQVREELSAQLMSTVRWEACVRAIAGAGVASVVECGPGRILSGLVRKIDRSLATFSTGSATDLDETLAKTGGATGGAV